MEPPGDMREGGLSWWQEREGGREKGGVWVKEVEGAVHSVCLSVCDKRLRLGYSVELGAFDFQCYEFTRR